MTMSQEISPICRRRVSTPDVVLNRLQLLVRQDPQRLPMF